MIVTYNSEEEIDGCLNALARFAPDLTVMVIDNASVDATRSIVAGHNAARLIANRQNVGFAAAVNQGVRAFPDASVILLLNPDCRLKSTITDLLLAAREGGLAGGQLVGVDGTSQSGFTIRRFPSPLDLTFEVLGLNRLWIGNPINRRYRYLDRDLGVPGPVEQPAGAFLAFRRDVWDRIGGFDESFHPVWFEDVDFCQRAANAGLRSSYIPSAVAEHSGGHSVKKLSGKSRVTYWYASLLLYAGKHYRPIPYRGICVAVMISTIPRMLVEILKTRSLLPAVSYGKVFTTACVRFFAPQPRLFNPVTAGSVT